MILLIVIILFLVWFKLDSFYKQHLLSTLRENVTVELSLYANRFTNSVNRRLALIEGLHSFVSIDTSSQRLENKFEIYVSALYKSTPGIRNFASSPGGIQTYVYPLEKNKPTIGHNLLTDKRPAVQLGNKKLFGGQKTHIRGPINLRQGGQGLIITKAVFLKGDYRTGTFWGFTSMAVDMMPIFIESGIEGENKNLTLAMTNDNSVLFYGKKEVLGSNPVILDVIIGYETWQIAGIPKKGWNAEIYNSLLLYRGLSGLVFLLLLTLCFVFIFNRISLELTIEKKTEDLKKSNKMLESEIKDRNLAEISLKESERQLRLMIKKSPLPMVITKENQDIEYYNDKFSELFGYTLDDISTSEKWWKTCYPDEEYRSRVQQSWMDAIENAESNNTDIERQEFEWTIKDKSKRLCEYFMVPLGGSSLTIMNDITDRKRTEHALSESEERFRKIIQNTKAGYFFIDQQGKFQNVNNAWLEMHKFSSADEIIGKHFSITQISNDIELAQKNVESTMSGTSIIADEFSRQNKDGSIGHQIFSTNPVEKDGKVIGLEGFLIDISERKKAEEQIKASLKEKETLLQEIHHRVKNNMTVISSLLKLQMTSVTDEKAKEALQDSQNRVQTMSMIHEALYRSDTLSTIDMKTYLSELGRIILQGYTVGDKVNLNIETDGILIGAKQASTLGLIVNELITNSLKYAFPDDRQGEIKIGLQKKEDQIELEYADKGIGMPEGFDWHKAKSLGLKLVRTLVENQLDGSIDMESKNGTKFTIKFNIET